MTGPVRTDIGRVVAEASIWPRQLLDPGRVAEFAGLFRDGDLEALPPLDVVLDGNDLLLADGWHRLRALEAIGAEHVLVQVIDLAGLPPAEAVYRHALATASTAALPLTRAERRTAVVRLLTDYPELADREIARLVGVSPSTVGAHRQRLLGHIDTVGDGEVAEALYAAATGADELARRLARSLGRIFEQRGLTDYLLGDRTGRRLAKALVEVHGDDEALVWARRLQSWAQSAIGELAG